MVAEIRNHDTLQEDIFGSGYNNGHAKIAKRRIGGMLRRMTNAQTALHRKSYLFGLFHSHQLRNVWKPSGRD